MGHGEAPPTSADTIRTTKVPTDRSSTCRLISCHLARRLKVTATATAAAIWDAPPSAGQRRPKEASREARETPVPYQRFVLQHHRGGRRFPPISAETAATARGTRVFINLKVAGEGTSSPPLKKKKKEKKRLATLHIPSLMWLRLEALMSGLHGRRPGGVGGGVCGGVSPQQRRPCAPQTDATSAGQRSRR